MSLNKLGFKILLLRFDKLAPAFASWANEIVVRKKVQIRSQTPVCRTGKRHER
jgi:hypothetical protein